MEEQDDRSLWLILAGIAIFSVWYTLTRRTENALWLVLAAVCILILAYRLYGAFVASRTVVLENRDGNTGNSHLPTERWVLFGYQFASTAGIGILIGPVLAAQFGYLPGYVWILVGAVLAGAVHDLVLLVLSNRHKGAFLPLLVSAELTPWSGLAVWGIVLVALPLFLAMTASVLADLLVGNMWAIYSAAITVVVALLVFAYERVVRPGRMGEAIGIGIALSIALIFVGSRLAMRPVEDGLLASRGFIIFLVGAYCFLSAMLPLYILGRARGAISGWISLLGVAMLALGIAFGAPSLRQPATTVYTSGNGPLLAGGVFPYLFIIITSGAISGFHALISTGLTSRLLNREIDALPVGFGSMLAQGLLVILILLSACTLYRWDFYAITTQLTWGEVDRVAQVGQRDWDNLRNMLQTDHMRIPGGPTNNPQMNYTRSGSTLTAVSVSSAWLFRDVPGVKREWLPILYRLAYVLQVLILLAGLEAATHVSKIAIVEVTSITLHMPSFARFQSNTALTGTIVAVATGVFTLVWMILASWTNVMAVLHFFGFVALLLATVSLGVAIKALWDKGRWYTLTVVLAFIITLVATLFVAGVTVRDSAHYISREDAIAAVYADVPRWGSQLTFVNLDRAREVVSQWKAVEVAKLFTEKGQVEAARQIQGRFGLSESDAKKLATLIVTRASGLSLWSWFQLVLTMLLLILGFAVGLGSFIRVPLRWPVRFAPAPQPAQVVPRVSEERPALPAEGSDFEI